MNRGAAAGVVAAANAMPIALRRASWFSCLLLVACLGSPPAGAVASDPPPALVGEARDLVLAKCTADGPLPRAGLYGPGRDQSSAGAPVAYDRWLLVGGLGAAPGTEGLEAFLARLQAAGGHWWAYQAVRGVPARALVVVDGQRIVLSQRQW